MTDLLRRGERSFGRGCDARQENAFGKITDWTILVAALRVRVHPSPSIQIQVWRKADETRLLPFAPGRERRTQTQGTLRTMAKYQVRRLPVIDGHQLVGIVAQADVARALPNDVVGHVLEEVSEK